jgi:nucleoside-triphosphatase THEP1
MPPRISIVCGPSGSGKTTLCLALILQLRDLGWRVAGLVSPAILDDGLKTGIAVRNIVTGENRVLAQRLDTRCGQTGMRWRFDESALAWGSEILAGARACDALFIDELGPLELSLNDGWSNARHMLGSDLHCEAIITVRRSLLSVLQERFLSGRVAHVFEMTPDHAANVQMILAHLTKKTGGPS